ncbi:MAG: glycoside hydrolase family 25 protein [Lawsonibacter sp.]|nr:glycoside hydrolase family 25 protein [Lawsonibacter sp.]
MSDYPEPIPGHGPVKVPSGKRRPKQNGWFRKAIAVCSALALMAGAAFGLMFLRETMTPKPITFVYRDQTLTAKEGVQVNAYQLTGFGEDEQGRICYQENGCRAKAGIDVSFYQGEIDWPAVAADGVEFAMIRLGYRGYTEGTLQMDSRFEENIRGALEAGLEVGVYFFSQAITPEEAEAEANFVLEAIRGHDVTYPVAYDWEFVTPGKGARTDAMDGQTLTQCAQAFCRTIAQAGYAPLVYFNQDLGYLTYDLSQLAEFSFWLAEYNGAPHFYYGFSLWQYTHGGSVAGIEGSVDWNLDLRPAVAQNVQ